MRKQPPPYRYRLPQVQERSEEQRGSEVLWALEPSGERKELKALKGRAAWEQEELRQAPEGSEAWVREARAHRGAWVVSEGHRREERGSHRLEQASEEA